MAIPPVEIKLAAPTGGEVIPAGGKQAIAWTASAKDLFFDLLYSEDNGVSWSEIATSITRSHLTGAFLFPMTTR